MSASPGMVDKNAMEKARATRPAAFTSLPSSLIQFARERDMTGEKSAKEKMQKKYRLINQRTYPSATAFVENRTGIVNGCVTLKERLQHGIFSASERICCQIRD